MRITIDAGHNSKSNVSPTNSKYIEGVQMFRLAQFLKAELEDYGVEVVLTRQKVTDDPTLAKRGQMAGKNKSDLFISLHSNSPAPDKAGMYDTSITGTCVYYSLTDPKNVNLADDLGVVIAKTMGHKFRGSLIRRYSDSKSNVDYYGVIRNAAQNGCKAAFLIEHGFHTCPADIAFLMSDSKLKSLAKAEAEVIAEYFGADKQPEKLYRVWQQIGAYSSKANAEAHAEKLRKQGKKVIVE